MTSALPCGSDNVTPRASFAPSCLIPKFPFYVHEEKQSEVKVLVAQSCSTLCDSMDCNLPSSSIHGILTVRHDLAASFRFNRQQLISSWIFIQQGFPGCSVVKNLPANPGDVSLIPGSGRSPGEDNVNPVQYSCLENSMDRGAWRATVHGVTKS